MPYIYIAGIACLFVIILIVGVWLLKGRPGNVVNTLVWSFISISVVTLFNIFWSGFNSNFYWGHSDSPSQNSLNVAARLICKSNARPDMGCRLEKEISSYKLIVSEDAELSEDELKEMKYRSKDVGLLLFLIESNYGKHVYIETH
ncbi:MAG: hypothetical protein ACJAWL_001123 [Motiliproteus sp.]|jgi:hypothetical protein